MKLGRVLRTTLAVGALIGVAACAAPPPAPDPAPSNRLVNGGFEAEAFSPSITGWTTETFEDGCTLFFAPEPVPCGLVGSVTYDNVQAIVQAPSGAGSNVLSLRASGNGPPTFEPPPGPITASQSVPLPADCVGSLAVFSAYAALKQGAAGFTVEFVGSGVQAQLAIADSGPSADPIPMSQYTYSGVVPAGTTAITVSLQSLQANFVYADLVSLRVLGC